MIVLEKEPEKELPEEKEVEREEFAEAEITSDGKYKCRICGQVFDTFVAHDQHHHEMHEQTGEPIMHPFGPTR